MTKKISAICYVIFLFFLTQMYEYGTELEKITTSHKTSGNGAERKEKRRRDF